MSCFYFPRLFTFLDYIFCNALIYSSDFVISIDRRCKISFIPFRLSEGKLSEHRYAQFLGEFVPATFTKNEFLLSCVFAFEIAHIFYDPDDLMICVLCHCPCPCSYKGSCRMWCGQDDLLTVRQQLMNIQCHISRTRRQVEEQTIEFSPLHFVEETVDHLAEHRPPPDDRSVFLYEERHCNHFDTNPLNGNQCFILYFR